MRAPTTNIAVALAVLAAGVAGCRASTAIAPGATGGKVATVGAASGAAPTVDEGVCVTTDVLDQSIEDGNMQCVGNVNEAAGDPHATPGAFAGSAKKGRNLFFTGQFGTNGRTCGTCHGPITGTISPAEVEARFEANPNEPLFRAIDSDGGDGVAYGLLRARATIKVHIGLPDNVCVLRSDAAGLVPPDGVFPPNAASQARALCSSTREVVLNRGVPTMFNTPALDPLLMSDGREDDVATQAGDAVKSHFEATAAPSASDLAAVADFERTLFTSRELAALGKHGVAPALPMPDPSDPAYASQLRGRDFFIEQPFDPAAPKKGLCAQCHGGPMLDTVQGFFRLTDATSGVGKNALGSRLYPGDRFANTAISQSNGSMTRDRIDAGTAKRLAAGPMGPFNPAIPFLVTQPDGTTVLMPSADPGQGLITGKVDNWNDFRIPTLWNVKNTAPYFHDNSAQTLEDVAHLYAQFFAIIEFAEQNIVLTPEDEADIVAYLRLL